MNIYALTCLNPLLQVITEITKNSRL